MNLLRLLLPTAATLLLSFHSEAKTPEGKPLILFLAGHPSHGPGEHEHNAGVQLLAKCLNQGAPQVATRFHLNAEWPSPEELAQADTIVFYADGGGGHPLLKENHLAQIEKEIKRGAGFVCLHYAVEFPADNGGPQALQWMGGYFEANWSVNPHWEAGFKELPQHPISSGVQPFTTNDEWYFHMRFAAPDAGKLTHILSAVPPETTMNRKDGPHEGNPTVRAEVAAHKPQTTAWAFERTDGGRGFGFTGGHFHKGWAQNDQRKLVLNALLWTAHVDVPPGGVNSTVSDEELAAHLDAKTPKPKPAASSNAPKGPAVPLFASGVVHDQPVSIKVELKGARELFLVATDAGDGFVADWADWAEPTLTKADGSKLKLTEIKPKFTSVGFGEFHVDQNAAGHPMILAGQPVAFGFGAHAPSVLAFDLPEGISTFEARGGVDKGGTDQKSGATVIFQVYTSSPVAQIRAASEGPAGKGAGAVPIGDRYGLEKAQQNMAGFTTPNGLQPSLFAAEPMIQNPTSIDIDPAGRVWATECVNYRRYLELRPEGDRVVILADPKASGAASKEITFFQDPRLTNPLGICVLPGPGGGKKGTQVIVSAAPNVWLLTDTKGEDKADQAEIILTVAGNWNHDHQIHAFSFGPDGKLYFNMGNEARDLKWPDGSHVVDVAGNEIKSNGKPYRGGMVFRADLTGGKLHNIETLGWNFRNNYKVAVDSFGTIWQSDNDDDGNKGVRINYVMQYGNYGYSDEMTGESWQTKRTNIEADIPSRHWHQNDPGVVPNLLQTGAGSPTGIVVNEGSALGSQFTNQVIHCDAGPRIVRAYPVEKSGAGFKATMTDILTSADPWYRPADAAIAPDGSLYVADWYDQAVGGHGMADHEKGKVMGRIYRVGSTGAASKAPALDLASPEGAVKALQSPNRATIYAAWQTLRAMDAKAEPALSRLWKSENPRMRARALALLARLGSGSQHLTAGLTDRDPDVRVAAIRLVKMLTTTGSLDTSSLESNPTLVGTLLKDPDPQVRREIALALHGGKDIAKLWTALALQHDGKDRWYLEALGIGASGNDDACLESWLAAAGSNWNTPGGRDIIWRSRSVKAADYLAKILSDSQVPASEKPRFLRAFDFIAASTEKTNALVQLATAAPPGNEIAMQALTRLKGVDLHQQPAVASALKASLEGARGTSHFVELVRDFGIKDQAQGLLDAALSIGNDPAAGDAVRMIFAEPSGAQLINAALSAKNATAVIALLGSTGTTAGAERLTALAGDNSQPLEQRQQAVKSLAGSLPGATALIKLAKNQALPPELQSLAGTALRQVQYPSLTNEIALLFPAPGTLGGTPLPPIASLAKISGDAAKGRAVFERAESSCISCHRINDKGVDFAPALSEIGSKLPKEAIYDAIINPNASISMGFETSQIALKNGGLAMGIVRSETPDEVVLALPGGITNKLRKSDIVKREKLATSMMPSGLNQALTQDDLVNLVEYLASLKKSAAESGK